MACDYLHLQCNRRPGSLSYNGSLFHISSLRFVVLFRPVYCTRWISFMMLRLENAMHFRAVLLPAEIMSSSILGQ